MIDWDAQNAIFLEDNEWQMRMRDSILVPYYERVYRGRYELIDPKSDPRAAGGCDTILDGKRIDEKIVRWPIDKETKKPREYGYDAFAFETWSCTIEDYVKLGWMATNDVAFILYCFVSLDQKSMICYLIDYPQLHKWFYSQPEDRWPPSYSNQANRTLVRVVPIADVVANVWTKQFSLSRPQPQNVCKACGRPDANFVAIGDPHSDKVVNAYLHRECERAFLQTLGG